MTVSLLGVKDVDTRRVLRNLAIELDRLTQRVSVVVSEEGSFIGNLGVNTVMSTTDGDLGVTAGAIAVLNDTDDVPEGTANLWLNGAGDSDSLTEGTTKKFVGSSGTGDLDDVDDGTTYKRVASVSASNLVTDSSIEAGADIDPSKILISGAVDLDDWRDAVDATKIAAAELSGNTPNALGIATTNPQPAGFVRAGAVRAMNAIGADGITIAGNIEQDVTGVDDGSSVTGLGIDVSGNLNDSGTGGGGTGEGGDPVEP